MHKAIENDTVTNLLNIKKKKKQFHVHDSSGHVLLIAAPIGR